NLRLDFGLRAAARQPLRRGARPQGHGSRPGWQECQNLRNDPISAPELSLDPAATEMPAQLRKKRCDLRVAAAMGSNDGPHVDHLRGLSNRVIELAVMPIVVAQGLIDDDELGGA